MTNNEELFPKPANWKTFYKSEQLPEINKRRKENGLPELSEEIKDAKSVCYNVPKGTGQKICFVCNQLTQEGQWQQLFPEGKPMQIKWRHSRKEDCVLARRVKKIEKRVERAEVIISGLNFP